MTQFRVVGWLLLVLPLIDIKQANSTSIPQLESKQTEVETSTVFDDGHREIEGKNNSEESHNNNDDNFIQRVYEALQDLTRDGLVNPDVIVPQSNPADKRGRHQGFCFRKTKSGRFLPYICWKEGDQAD